jgi:transcriptional regulator with XRE-family HTH domain
MNRFSGTNDGQGAVPPPSERQPRTGGPAAVIGGRVASLRQMRGLRVSELARAAGISASLVSQIERGRTQPSVSTLFSISEALQVPVDSFFRGGPEPASPEPASRARQAPGTTGYLVRHADRAVIDIEGGVRWERLTPGPLPNVDFLELVYAARCCTAIPARKWCWC